MIKYVVYFLRPSSDGTYYGMVISVRLSVRVSVRPLSVHFSFVLWHIELKFCKWLYVNVLQIDFECRHFASIIEEVMSLLELTTLEIHSFLLHALRYWAEKLHTTLSFCTTNQFRVSSICVNFCKSYAPFGTLNILSASAA